MVKRPDTKQARIQRHKRVRGKVYGTAECPRLNVFRSLKNIYAQLIDDDKGVTLGGNADAAKAVGKKIAERAAEKGIKECVFDRGGYIYHGRVASLAEGAREGGLDF